MTKPSRHKSGAIKETTLSLRGVDTSSESGVMLRFAARGEAYSWEFKAATFDELVALALGGRLGAGKDVHFDAAKVSFKKGRTGRQGSVRIAIGRKVRIVAPVRGPTAAAIRKAVVEMAVKKAAVKRPAGKKLTGKKLRAPRKLPAA